MDTTLPCVPLCTVEPQTGPLVCFSIKMGWFPLTCLHVLNEYGCHSFFFKFLSKRQLKETKREREICHNQSSDSEACVQHIALWSPMTIHNKVHILNTSHLKSLPLPSCTTPFTALSPLLLLMILTLYCTAPLIISWCILFCLAASEVVKWGRKWAKAYHCLSYWDIYGRPYA